MTAIQVYNAAGEKTGLIELDPTKLDIAVRKALLKQALIAHQASQRQGSHKTKDRGEVAGGGRKPFRQKGTGRARQGSTRAPNWVGGGTVFGPRPRKYIKHLPKKMNAAALRSALSAKAAADQIVVVDAYAFDAPKTKNMVQALRALGVPNDSILMVMQEKSTAVIRSASNLPNVKTILSGYINIRDLLGYDKVLLSKDALEHIELWLTPANYVAEDYVAEEAEIEGFEDTGSAPKGTEA